MANESFDILIRTKAELQAAEKARAELEKSIKVTKDLGKDSSALEKDLQRVNAALNSQAAQTLKVQAASQSAASAMKALTSSADDQKKGLSSLLPNLAAMKTAYADAGGGLSGVLAAVGGSSGKAVAAWGATIAGAIGAKKALSDFAHVEEDLGRLDAALARRGLLTEEYRKQLHQLAAEMKEQTGLGWIESLRTLTQFGAGPENIERLADATKNLAGIIDGDLSTSAFLVAKAMQGSFEMFERYGIHVKDAATQTEKFNLLLKDLEARGAGQLEQRMKGVSGSFREFEESTKSLSKSVGSVIASTGIVQTALGIFSFVIKAVASAFKVGTAEATGFKNALDGVTTSGLSSQEAANLLAARLKQIEINADDATKKLIALKNATQFMTQEERKLNEANKAHDLAVVSAMEKAGLIKKPDADVIRTGIETEYRKKNLELDNRADVVTKSDNEKRVDQLRRERAQAEKEDGEAEKRLNTGKARDFRGQVAVNAENDVRRIKERIKLLSENMFALGSFQLDDLKQLKAMLPQAERLASRERDRVPSGIPDTQTLELQKKNAKAVLDDARKREREEGQPLQTENAQASVRMDTRAKANRSEEETARIKAITEQLPDRDKQRDSTVEALKRGQPVNGRQAVDGLAQVMGDFKSLVDGLIQLHAISNADIARLKSDFGQLKQQQSNARNK